MADISDMLDEPFVSLTTFRRSGAPVATPLWAVRTGSGDAALVDDAAAMREVERALRAKYGLQYRVVRVVEKLRPRLAQRVVIRVSG